MPEFALPSRGGRGREGEAKKKRRLLLFILLNHWWCSQHTITARSHAQNDHGLKAQDRGFNVDPAAQQNSLLVYVQRELFHRRFLGNICRFTARGGGTVPDPRAYGVPYVWGRALR